LKEVLFNQLKGSDFEFIVFPAYSCDVIKWDKYDQKVKVYNTIVTESCDKDQKLNLIGLVDARDANTSDVSFLQDGIEKAQEVFTDKIEYVEKNGVVELDSK